MSKIIYEQSDEEQYTFSKSDLKTISDGLYALRQELVNCDVTFSDLLFENKKTELQRIEQLQKLFGDSIKSTKDYQA